MPVEKSVSLRVLANIREYEKQIAKMPPAMQREARAAGRHLQREFVKSQVAAGKSAQKAASQTSQAWKNAGAAVLAAFSVQAMRAVARNIAMMAQATADLRNELADTAVKSGLTAETLNGLRLAAEGSGLEFNSLVRGLQALPKLLDDAAHGIGLGADAYDRLGVSVKNADGSLRSADAVFRDTVRALQGVESATERAALASGALGTSLGPRVLQAIGEGTGALDRFIDSAAEFGLGTGPAAMKAAADWQRQQALLTLALDKAKAVIGDVVIESGLLEESLQALVTITPILGALIKDTSEQISGLASALTTAWEAVEFFMPAWEGQLSTLKLVGGAFLSATTRIDKATAAYEKGAKSAAKLNDTTLDLGESLDEYDAALQVSIVSTKEIKEVQARWAKQQASNASAARKFAAEALKAEQELAAARGVIFNRGIARGKENSAAIQASIDFDKQMFSEMSDWGNELADKDAEKAQQRLDDRRDATRLIAGQLVSIMGDAFSAISVLSAKATQEQVAQANRLIAKTESTASEIEAIDAKLAELRGEITKELTETQLEAERKRLVAASDASRSRAEFAKRAAMDAFRREQQVAKASIAINAAILATGIASNLSKLIGPFAIPIAAGLAGGAAAAQVAIVNAQSPPTFHGGGIVDGGVRPQVSAGPDAVPILARPGEEVTTPGDITRGGPVRRVTNWFVGGRLADRITETAQNFGGRAAANWKRQIEAGDLPGLARVY